VVANYGESLAGKILVDISNPIPWPRYRRTPLLGPSSPAGHRDRNPVSGKVTDQRVFHFGEISWAKYAAARRRISFPAPASCSASAAPPTRCW
jgi:hypothetical protein